jgi:hypothetical protein
LVLALGVGFFGALGAVAETVPDYAYEEVAGFYLVLAEGVHVPVARSEILHADAVPVVEFLQGGECRFAVGAQVGAGGA